MKLPLKKSTSAVVPNWHPNFRNAATLPDLKLIRTSFFVNAVFVTIALGAVLFTVQREYAAMSLTNQIQSTEAHMVEVAPRNAAVLAQSREFADAARKGKEASDFVSARFAVSDLLVALSRSLPTYMEFTSIVYENSQLVLKGTIRGSSDTATDRLSSYLDVLRQDGLIGREFSDVTLNNFGRDQRNQSVMTFEILLKTKA